MLQAKNSGRLLCLFLAILLAGCDGASQSRVTEMNDLKSFGLLYIKHMQSEGVGPKDWQELTGAAGGTQTLQQAGCMVAWGVNFNDAASVGSANFILALTPQTKEGGGSVLMLDGSVKQLTNQEIAELLSAQKDICIPSA